MVSNPTSSIFNHLFPVFESKTKTYIFLNLIKVNIFILLYMYVKQKLFYSLITNVSILFFVFILIIVYKSDDSKYFRFGPHDDLIVISVRIDTINKYIIFNFVTSILKIFEVIIDEVGFPILSFNVYNPDKKIITEFSKNELQFYANSMYAVSNLRSVLIIVISVTQFDLALINVIVSEITTLFTIRMLLNEKKFIINNADYKEDIEFESLLT